MFNHCWINLTYLLTYLPLKSVAKIICLLKLLSAEACGGLAVPLCIRFVYFHLQNSFECFRFVLLSNEKDPTFSHLSINKPSFSNLRINVLWTITMIHYFLMLSALITERLIHTYLVIAQTKLQPTKKL